MVFSEVDLSRHISCEVCDVSVSGGYDSELNQVSSWKLGLEEVMLFTEKRMVW